MHRLMLVSIALCAAACGSPSAQPYVVSSDESVEVQRTPGSAPGSAATETAVQHLNVDLGESAEPIEVASGPASGDAADEEAGEVQFLDRDDVRQAEGGE